MTKATLGAAARRVNEVVDQLLTAIESAEQDVGHRPVGEIIGELGPAYETLKEVLESIAPEDPRNDPVQVDAYAGRLERALEDIKALFDGEADASMEPGDSNFTPNRAMVIDQIVDNVLRIPASRRENAVVCRLRLAQDRSPANVSGEGSQQIQTGVTAGETAPFNPEQLEKARAAYAKASEPVCCDSPVGGNAPDQPPECCGSPLPMIATDENVARDFGSAAWPIFGKLLAIIDEPALFVLTPPSEEMLNAQRYLYLRNAAGQYIADEDGPSVVSGLGDLFSHHFGPEVDEVVDVAIEKWKAEGSPLPPKAVTL